jgi:Tfp pilus assembly PilM family ATPase
MASLQEIWDRVEASASAAGLRPAYPPVVLDLEQSALSLVRFKKRRGRKPLLEAHVERAVDTPLLPDSIFEPAGVKTEGLSEQLQELFEISGTRPGRISLVLPDNLAKISLLHLPEKPAGPRELRELVHSKMRRAVPFRLEDVAISYQIVPGDGREVSVLVVLVHRAVIERLEAALERVGARPGLVDLATPNLLNVCRPQIDQLGSAGGDVALLNCAGRYFSLVITRRGRVIFYRCKTFAPSADGSGGPNGSLVREVGHSFSYYREKLGGEGISAVLLRATSVSTDTVMEQLSGLDCGTIRALDLGDSIELGEGVRLDAAAAQRLAPSFGAAIARGA